MASRSPEELLLSLRPEALTAIIQELQGFSRGLQRYREVIVSALPGEGEWTGEAAELFVESAAYLDSVLEALDLDVIAGWKLVRYYQTRLVQIRGLAQQAKNARTLFGPGGAPTPESMQLIEQAVTLYREEVTYLQNRVRDATQRLQDLSKDVDPESVPEPEPEPAPDPGVV